MMEVSPISSQKSSPELQRQRSRQDSTGSAVSAEISQANILQRAKEPREQQLLTSASQQAQSQNTPSFSAEKPPIPPRGVFPPVPQRQTSYENIKRDVFGKNICIRLKNHYIQWESRFGI